MYIHTTQNKCLINIYGSIHFCFFGCWCYGLQLLAEPFCLLGGFALLRLVLLHPCTHIWILIHSTMIISKCASAMASAQSELIRHQTKWT